MMQTRCPACGTSFRITAEQLKLRQGRVRCGRCHFVFNALEALVVDEGATAAPSRDETATVVPSRKPLPEPPPRPAQKPTPAPAPTPTPTPTPTSNPTPTAPTPPPSAPPAVQIALPAESAPPPAQTPSEAVPERPGPRLFEPVPVFASPTPAKKEPPLAAPLATETPRVAAIPAAAPKLPPRWPQAEGDFALTSIDEVVYATDAPGSPSDIDFELPEIRPLVIPHTVVDHEPLLHEPPRPRTWPWALVSIVALLLLAGQVIYVYRVDLTAWQPDLRPPLEDACAALGCDVPLPQQVKLIDIEASDLNPDANAKGHLRLTATLKNRAPFAQQFPNLELTLTDSLDRPLASRVLAPADYLPVARDVVRGFAAREDLAITIPLEVVGMTASGYRLYLFYP